MLFLLSKSGLLVLKNLDCKFECSWQQKHVQQTEKKIMKRLCFNSDNVVIFHNPDRENMNISVLHIHVPNRWLDIPLADQRYYDGFERHLIF